ncbi:MAG: 30S ribosomal protein S9 [Patescibacteria group bacterium]|nr:30S ribosomal protein S9 [Patescibacteria group bacterium]MDD5490496.1 30S ribosomal protein S9 [Patescibacteria group bacterium]
MAIKTTETIKDARKYFYGVGRRKSATARVRLYEKGKGEIKINGKDYTQHFPRVEQQRNVLAPLKLVGLDKKVDVSVIINGGGVHGQSEAVRHGISRALIALKPEEFKAVLRAEGFLTRDPRVKERKKPGLKRARRAPQWAKR